MTQAPERLDQYVTQQAGERPDAPALRQAASGNPLSYSTLEHHVTSTARALADKGLRPGDRLLIVTENCIEVAVLILATHRAGAIAAPVNARMKPDELTRIIEDAEPRLIALCSAASDAARDHAVRLGASPFHWPAPGLAETRLTQLREATAEDMPTGPDRPAVLLYTTGTTGRAKGVLLSHGNLIYGGGSSARLRDMMSGDCILGVLPVTHVFGLTSMLGASLIAGAELWLWPRFSAAEVLDALQDGVTLFAGVPQMHALIMAEAEKHGVTRLEAPKLRYISSGAAPLDPGWKSRAEVFYGAPVQNGYGMTETTSGVSLTDNPPGDPDASVGRVMPGCEVRIRPVGDDPAVGEVMVRGPNVMLRYFRNPEATAAVLDPDGFLHSGDLGRFDVQGRLHIVGRLKELIIHSGFNIYPPEVEAALTSHPDVVQAAVVGRPYKGNEQVVAFVQCRNGATATEDSLRAHAARSLTGYKIPSRVIVIDEMPAAPSGKILKHLLLEHFADRLG